MNIHESAEDYLECILMLRLKNGMVRSIDIVHDLDGVLDAFDRALGLSRLRAIHLNDSKNPFASHKDRHEKIGQGCIGLDALAAVINHPRLRDLPFYLETPQDDVSGYGREIALLKGLYH